MSNQSIDNLKFVNEVREKMARNNVMLTYRGRMSQEIVIALLNLTETRLNQSEPDMAAKSRVYSILIECLQNIAQHSERDEHSDSSMFMIGETGEEYSVCSGNIVKSANKVEELTDKISKLNSMSEEELKEFHRYWMMNESLSPKHGFGLGLIEIARKTGNPIDFRFDRIDEESFFFSLSTKVNR